MVADGSRAEEQPGSVSRLLSPIASNRGELELLSGEPLGDLAPLPVQVATRTAHSRVATSVHTWVPRPSNEGQPGRQAARADQIAPQLAAALRRDPATNRNATPKRFHALIVAIAVTRANSMRSS